MLISARAVAVNNQGPVAMMAAWPITVRAQQSVMPVGGFLSSASPASWAPFVAGFRKGLNETGLIEGQNVTIEYRWAEGDYNRLSGLVAGRHK